VYCLVRATSEKEGWKRLTEVLRTYQIWKPQYKKRITILPGALGKPLLGIDEKIFQTLGGEIDSIFHIGAFVNHALAYEQHKGANVLGTQEVLRLACTRQLKPFYLISSLAILEGIKIKPIPEDSDIDESGELANGYVESKWVSEKLTLLARSRGVPCMIFRLPRVGGDSQIGSGPTGDFLWRLIQASIKLKMVPRIDATDDLTPVDYVCKSIRIISQNSKWIHSQFHVISPYVLRYLDVFKFLQALGYLLPFVDFSTWCKALVDQSKKTKDRRLQALAALLTETHFTKPLHALTFSSNHLREALKGSRLKCPPIDQKLFKKYVDYYVSMGFLPKY
jgi:thioester reductase-like protein